MKDDSQPRENYHHGNLPEALISKGAELLAEKGPEKFSMREVARRAGVAVAAPAHHFGNAKGLLTAIATVAFERLTDEQRTAMETTADPTAKVIALVHAYIDMNTRCPGYAAVLFRWDLVDKTNPAHQAAAAASFDLLQNAVAAAAQKDVPQQNIQHAAKAIWAMTHGMIALSLTNGPEADARITFAVKAILTGL